MKFLLIECQGYAMSFLATAFKYQALVSKKTSKALFKKAAENNQNLISTFHHANGRLHSVDKRI